MNRKFHRSSPHLPVRNLKETLDYYRTQLGFYDEWTWGNTDGGLRRDELRMLFGEDPEHTARINSTDRSLNLMWFVTHIEEIYREWHDRGIHIESTLQTYDYGLKEFAFTDINGYYIRVAESYEST